MPPSFPDDQCIQVRGARVHNLQNVDVDIPHNRLVVVTGVSGSGKSSLAFDTLFAEGQRRYLESLSTWSRQYLQQLQRPDVDRISGLPPTISIDQRTGAAHPRSTLATITEIHDYLRLLFARAGTAHCSGCGRVVERQPVRAIVDQVLNLDERTKVMVLAPLVRGRRGKHREVFERIAREGFVRARVDDEMHEASDPPDLSARKSHTIEAVVDRLIVKPGIEDRLRESVELAVTHGQGTCIVSRQDGDDWTDTLFSTEFACPDCSLSFPPIEPRSFSFNSPYGACEDCSGLGTREVENSEDAESGPAAGRCPTCDGTRLAAFPRSVTVNGIPIHEFLANPIRVAHELCRGWMEGSDTEAPQDEHTRVMRMTLPEVTSRLRYLERVGLGYLTLDRPTKTLSGGEFQRARLAACVGSQLTGSCYILDEPTLGLHPADTDRLFETLVDLRDRGNTVVLVEHDIDLIRGVDWVIDLGPGAGNDGGRIVVTGSPGAIADSPDSATGRFLRDGETAASADRRSCDDAEHLVIRKPRLHNLQGQDVAVPLQRFVVVTGISGSGKSSLVTGTLVPELRRRINNSADDATATSRCAAVDGVEHVERLLVIDQSPIGRSGRSNPATYSNLWNEVRRLFGRTREARIRGFSAGRFSFNSKDGRCPECSGHGQKRIEMNFLPDVHVTCPSCRGGRFNRQTLSIRFKGRTVADVLAMRFDEACDFFSEVAKLHGILKTFVDVGLGYLTLGQSSLTLSGGEAQRVRLATELSQTGRTNSLFVLDEPTTGLHAADVSRLLDLLQKLVDQQHSVVVVEHQVDVIAAADWVIDLGPGSGDDGGAVVASGPPHVVANEPASLTGKALRMRPC